MRKLRLKKKKYDEFYPVAWHDILKCLEWALIVRKNYALNMIEEVEKDLKHNYPDCLDLHISRGLFGCEFVFKHFELVNSLRAFLQYSPKSPKRFGIDVCYDFYSQYNKNNPCSDGLNAHTTRIDVSNG